MLGKFTNDNGCLWSSTHQKWFTNWTFTNQNGEIVVMYPINMVKKRGFHEQTSSRIATFLGNVTIKHGG